MLTKGVVMAKKDIPKDEVKNEEVEPKIVPPHSLTK